MNTSDYVAWREKLAEALTTNSDKQFSRKHAALANRIRETEFPDPTILKYYTHPIISSDETLATFKPEWQKPDFGLLIGLCQELFEWTSRGGLCRLMRSFTPGFLVWDLVHATHDTSKRAGQEKAFAPTKLNKPKQKPPAGKLMTDFFRPTKSIPDTQVKPLNAETPSILDIHGTRKHPSNDYLEELRVSFIPSQVQPYTMFNFKLTPDDWSSQLSSSTNGPSKRPLSNGSSESTDNEFVDEELLQRKPKWSPDEITRIWIPKAYIRHALPAKLEAWHQSEVIRKTLKKKVKGTSGTQRGAMDQFVRRGSRCKLSETCQSRCAIRKENAPPNPLTPVRKDSVRKENEVPCETPSKQVAVGFSMLTFSTSDEDDLPSPRRTGIGSDPT
jgi:Holliday junction resolvase Gen1 C-terminal domain